MNLWLKTRFFISTFGWVASLHIKEKGIDKGVKISKQNTDFETIIQKMIESSKKPEKLRFLAVTNQLVY